MLQRAWHVGRHQWCDLWQQADTLVTPLSERPLWCVAAGLLAGSLLGTAVDLPLVPLSGALLVAGLLLPTLAFAPGAALLSPGPGGPGPDLAATRLATVRPASAPHRASLAVPPQHVTVEGTLDRAVDARGDRQYVYLRLHRLEGDRSEQPVTGLCASACIPLRYHFSPEMSCG